jgi:hypothetical protein
MGAAGSGAASETGSADAKFDIKTDANPTKPERHHIQPTYTFHWSAQ